MNDGYHTRMHPPRCGFYVIFSNVYFPPGVLDLPVYPARFQLVRYYSARVLQEAGPGDGMELLIVIESGLLLWLKLMSYCLFVAIPTHLHSTWRLHRWFSWNLFYNYCSNECGRYQKRPHCSARKVNSATVEKNESWMESGSLVGIRKASSQILWWISFY